MGTKKEIKLSYTNINLNSQTPTFPNFRKYKNWINYGDNNDFPQRIINLNNQSAVNKAILDNKVTYILGDGIDDSEFYFGTPNQTDTWDSFIEKITKDYVMFGGFCFQVITNQDGTSFSLYHTDFSKVRCGDFNEFGIILNYYISNDWTKTAGRTAPVGVKAWGTEQPIKGERYLYYYKDYTSGLDYYPIPSYYSAIDYVEADGLLAKFYRNSINNGFTPSTIITMPANPSDEEKEAFQAPAVDPLALDVRPDPGSVGDQNCHRRREKSGENCQLEHRRRHFRKICRQTAQKVCQHQIVEDMERHGPADGILHRHISQHQSHQKRVGRLQQVPVEQPEQERGTQDGKPLAVRPQRPQDKAPEDQLLRNGRQKRCVQEHADGVRAAGNGVQRPGGRRKITG